VEGWASRGCGVRKDQFILGASEKIERDLVQAHCLLRGWSHSLTEDLPKQLAHSARNILSPGAIYESAYFRVCIIFIGFDGWSYGIVDDIEIKSCLIARFQISRNVFDPKLSYAKRQEPWQLGAENVLGQTVLTAIDRQVRAPQFMDADFTVFVEFRYSEIQ
jgi:hypothetical protein